MNKDKIIYGYKMPYKIFKSYFKKNEKCSPKNTEDCKKVLAILNDESNFLHPVEYLFID